MHNKEKKKLSLALNLLETWYAKNVRRGKEKWKEKERKEEATSEWKKYNENRKEKRRI